MSGEWWRGAVFYEVYVRSFADSNDDGIGDLRGVIAHLDYVRSLGVDAIWLTPFYPSPQKDQGYDVAEYYDVDPEYGTLADFDELVSSAHRLDIKVIVDLVPNHTSDQHRWFQLALSQTEVGYRSRYHFARGREDGRPPNNWQSAFGGPAWRRNVSSGEWFLHLFAPEQPDLNWWNAEVPAEFERILRFWLDRGADGYRIDVASALYKRKDLADVPVATGGESAGDFLATWRSFVIDQPEVHDVYRAWRRIAEGYRPARILLGEIFDPRLQERYVRPDQLHLAFAMVGAAWDAAAWRRAIDDRIGALTQSGSAPSWTLSNHDVVRHVTRFGDGTVGRTRARAALVLLLGLPGQVVLYQGEELGLAEVDVPEASRQDPAFKLSAGRNPGRDGCRVPMPWHRGQPNAGFSRAAPWLPMPAGWDRYAVDREEGAGDSMLAFYRTAIGIRRNRASAWPSGITWVSGPASCLVYQRGRLTVACNFGARSERLALGGSLTLASHRGVALEDGHLLLPPASAAWVEPDPAAPALSR
jgi:alpha-glucosidase